MNMVPRMGQEMMTAVTLKELETSDGYRLSLRVQARKGKKSKYMRNLLPHLFIERPRMKTQLSLPHLLGDQAVDQSLDNDGLGMLQFALNLHNYLMDTWGLTPVNRSAKWNLHFYLMLTNPRGLVVREVTVLNWTEGSMSAYLKVANRNRKLTTHDELFQRCLPVARHKD